MHFLHRVLFRVVCYFVCHNEDECFFGTAVLPTDFLKIDFLSSCLTLDVVLLISVERVHEFQSHVVFHCNPVNADHCRVESLCLRKTLGSWLLLV